MSNKAPTIQFKKSRLRELVESPKELLTSLVENPEERFRLLKSSERVLCGDYIENGDSDFRLWEGPTGFRADSFLNKVYRTVQIGQK